MKTLNAAHAARQGASHATARASPPAAQQTYLLKNAVGRDLRVRSSRDATKESAVLHTRNLDLIQEDLNGTPGFLYWTAGRYVWLPTSKRAAK